MDSASNCEDERGKPVAVDHQPLAEQPLSRIEESASELTSETAAQDILLWLDRSAWLLERVKTFRQFVEQAAIEWINANGDLRLGNLRFTIGTQSVTRCVDIRETVHALMLSCGGDVDAFSRYLAANPFKYGSCRSILSTEVYHRLFLTEPRPKLVNGSPQKQLIRIDERFAHDFTHEADESKDK